jgi:hypothetical protein
LSKGGWFDAALRGKPNAAAHPHCQNARTCRQTNSTAPPPSPPPKKGTFFSFIGASKANPVNAALVTQGTATAPGAAVPMELYDGRVAPGSTIVWIGKPLQDTLKAIKTPGTKSAAALKVGESVEVKDLSVFIDGASYLVPAGKAEASKAAVQAAMGNVGEPFDIAKDAAPAVAPTP